MKLPIVWDAGSKKGYRMQGKLGKLICMRFEKTLHDAGDFTRIYGPAGYSDVHDDGRVEFVQTEFTWTISWKVPETP